MFIEEKIGFYVEDENEFEENKKKWVDPATLRIFNSPSKYIVRYVGDKNGIYFENRKIKGADVSNFEILEDGYAKDKVNIYFISAFDFSEKARKLEGADAASFRVKNAYSS